MLGTPEQEAISKAVITSDLGYHLGSHIAALCFDSLLIGVIICQMTHWFPNARSDSPMVRLLVIIAAAAACVSAAFTWAMYMYDFAFHFGTYFQFVEFRLLAVYGIVNVCTTIPVQLLFVERAIKVNNNSKVVAAISYFLATATFAGGLAVFIVTRGVTMLAVPGHVIALFQYWPTACLTAHLYNTVMIIYGLLKARNGNERADKLLKRLIRGCLEAQIPATTYAFVGMVVICNDPASPLIPFLLITHSKVYFVGALAMVNSRHTWRKEGVTPQSYNNETNMTSAPNLTNSAPTASESQVSSNRWPSTPPWGLEVEMGLTEDSDAIKREAEKESDEEKRSSLTRLSFLGRGNK